jgi:2'-5' RNA ligase
VTDEPVESVAAPEEPEPREPPPRPLRLFVAVNLQIASARRLADTVMKLRAQTKAKAKVSWVPAANLHVTLKFLGWARPEVVPAIRGALHAVAAVRRGFEIATRGFGGYPDLQAPRVLWAGIADPSGGLAALAQAVDKKMTALGFAAETRPFSAHVTIGRVREGWTPELSGLLPADAAFGTSLIREIVLYESETKSSGSEYIARARAPLAIPERQTRSVEEEGTRAEEPEAHGRQPT